MSTVSGSGTFTVSGWGASTVSGSDASIVSGWGVFTVSGSDASTVSGSGDTASPVESDGFSVSGKSSIFNWRGGRSSSFSGGSSSRLLM